MSTPTTEEMREAARELRAVSGEIARVTRLIGGDRTKRDAAEAVYLGAAAMHKRAYLRAHAASTSFHPERKVGEHKVAAEEASFEDWSRLNALEYELKALKDQAHSLRQILSAYQTEARIEASV